MNAYERMLSKLKPLNIYNLDEGSLMSLELKTYGHFIDEINAKLETAFKSFFYDEVTMQNCDHLIALYGLPKNISFGKLRSIIAARMAISNNDFTLDGIARSLKGFGITAVITENFATNTLSINVTNDMGIFLSTAEKTNIIKTMLPCFLNTSITI